MDEKPDNAEPREKPRPFQFSLTTLLIVRNFLASWPYRIVRIIVHLALAGLFGYEAVMQYKQHFYAMALLLSIGTVFCLAITGFVILWGIRGHKRNGRKKL